MQKSILIISSDKLDADGMKARLSSELTTVYIASNVEEAIGFLDVKNLCLVILDSEISQQDDHMLLKDALQESFFQLLFPWKEMVLPMHRMCA